MFSAVHPTTDIAKILRHVRFVPILLQKSFRGGERKILRAADASSARRREGPYRFSQNRPRTFVTALQRVATARKSRNQLSRNFRRRSIFDFCNTICQEATSPK